MAEPPQYHRLWDMVICTAKVLQMSLVAFWDGLITLSQVFSAFPIIGRLWCPPCWDVKTMQGCGCRLEQAQGLQGQDVGPGTTYQYTCYCL